ncbi:MAG: PsbP-related protein [Bacteroidota bacterium]
MKPLAYILILYFSAIAAQHAYAQEPWKTHERTGYTIDYPADWTLNTSVPGASFIITSPPDQPDDDFSENVNLIVEDLSGKNVTLERYTYVTVVQIGAMLPDSKIISNQTLKRKKLSFQKIVYTGTQEDFYMKYVQYYWIVDEHAFILTFICEDEKFEHYQATAERILDSFTFH